MQGKTCKIFCGAPVELPLEKTVETPLEKLGALPERPLEELQEVSGGVSEEPRSPKRTTRRRSRNFTGALF
jgi:hypothetical protein